MADRLRLGVIGAGAVTQVGHLPALKRIREIDVVGICDNDLPKARALADRFGVPDAFSDISELLDYESLNGVLICTPSHLHESQIQAALAAGLHIFVERPLALTSAGAAQAGQGGPASRPGGDGRRQPPLSPRRATDPLVRAERRTG